MSAMSSRPRRVNRRRFRHGAVLVLISGIWALDGCGTNVVPDLPGGDPCEAFAAQGDTPTDPAGDRADLGNQGDGSADTAAAPLDVPGAAEADDGEYYYYYDPEDASLHKYVWNQDGWYEADWDDDGWFEDDWNDDGSYEDWWNDGGWYVGYWNDVGWYLAWWDDEGWYLDWWDDVGWYEQWWNQDGWFEDYLRRTGGP